MRNPIYDAYEAPIRTDEMGITWEEADRYIQSWTRWEKCFSKSTLEWILENLSIGDICAIHYIPQKDVAPNGYWEKNYKRECIDNHHRFEEYHGNTDFHRTVCLPAIGYRVQYKYQSIGNLAKVYRAALLRDYPYLKEYKFEAYVPSYSWSSELYIKLPFKYNGEETVVTVYCPIKAFKDKNPQLIYDRHYSYNNDYYKGQSEYRNRILAALDSEEYKILCKKVMEG